MSTARSHVERASRQVAPALEALARFGYASKGVLYGTVGFLALSLALGEGGHHHQCQRSAAAPA